jgi:hypothetical protein
VRSAPAVLIVPMEQEFGWSRAAISFAIGVQLLVYGFIGPFSAGLVDSPAVVSAADEVGGSAFLSAHPNATRVWAVVGGLSFSGLSTSPEWIVEYTSCTLPTSITEVGSTFNATVGGTSGAVTMHANGTANCALTAPTGAGLTSRGAGGPAALRKAI